MSLTQTDRESLRSLIQDKLELGSVALEDTTQLKELYGIDSMKVLRLVSAVERCFSIDLGFESIPQIHTLVDIERLVLEARAARDARQLARSA